MASVTLAASPRRSQPPAYQNKEGEIKKWPTVSVPVWWFPLFIWG